LLISFYFVKPFATHGGFQKTKSYNVATLAPFVFAKKNAFEPVGSFMWPRCENFTAQKKKMLVED
jgi:hypothetical protein